ncbi:MAG: ribosomal protein S18-alanine N-acetyltransferase [Clostridiales bacterium]|jgi:ribosomal-protein-alanine N-acetyltransferase|nr:ribosomal protein S18-alanine N-acetyltransferase [Clostridiales bacterium]
MIILVEGTGHHAKEMHEIENEASAAAWSEISIKHEIEHDYTICRVAIDENEEVLGHAYMRHIVNEGHITNLAVRKSHHRRGIGTLLVNGLISAAQEREMIGLTLEVRAGNIAAIKLYEKHGFKAEGIRKNYYSQPTEDGIIMWNYFQRCIYD